MRSVTAIDRLRITQRAIGVVVEFIIAVTATEAAYNDQGQQNGLPRTSAHQRVSRDNQVRTRQRLSAARWNVSELKLSCADLAIEITQIDVQASKAVQQRAPRQTQLTGGEGLVTFVLAQTVEKQAALDLAKAFTQVEVGVG